MNCYCEDCSLPTRSYEDWIIHLTADQHQGLITSGRIDQWIREQNQTCIFLISLFAVKNPVEIATKFSKFGFLWNFYVHPDRKFFIVQYDTKQTAAFTLAKVQPATSWKLQIRPLKDLEDLDDNDWTGLFPPKPKPLIPAPTPVPVLPVFVPVPAPALITNNNYADVKEPMPVPAPVPTPIINYPASNLLVEPPPSKIRKLDTTTSTNNNGFSFSVASTSKSSNDNDSGHSGSGFSGSGGSWTSQTQTLAPKLFINPDTLGYGNNDYTNNREKTDESFELAINPPRPVPRPNVVVNLVPQKVEPKSKPSSSSAIFSDIKTFEQFPAAVTADTRDSEPQSARERELINNSKSFGIKTFENRLNPLPAQIPTIISTSNSGKRKKDQTTSYQHLWTSFSSENVEKPLQQIPLSSSIEVLGREPCLNSNPNQGQVPEPGPVPTISAIASEPGKPPVKLKSNPPKTIEMEFIMKLKEGSCIDEQLDEFFKSAALSLNELDKIKNTVLGSLTVILRKEWPNCDLYLLDTFQGGIGSPNNVLEINVGGLDEAAIPGSTPLKKVKKEEDQLSVKVISELSRYLESEMVALGQLGLPKVCDPVNIALRGKASRVKFNHSISARHKFYLTACTAASQLTRRNNFKLIAFYIRLNPAAVRSLLCLAHYWANYHSFIQFGFQQIRDYVLSLLVIVFLARKGVVPTLEMVQRYCKQNGVDVDSLDWLATFCNNAHLSEEVAVKIQQQFSSKNIFILDLAREFFDTYGKEQLTTQVICTWTGHFLPKTAFQSCRSSSGLPPELREYKKYIDLRPDQKLSTDTALCLQNPFELGVNIGGSTTINVLRKFQLGCRQTATLLGELLNPPAGAAEQNLNLMSIFVPIEKESPAPVDHTPAKNRRACETLLGRILDRVKEKNITLPRTLHERANTVDEYIYFDVELRFREEFKRYDSRKNSAVQAVSGKDKLVLNIQMSALWCIFAISFIRNIWVKCYYMDAVENRIYDELLEHEGAGGAGFPTGYKIYYSMMDCKGWLPLRAGFRWQSESTSTTQQASMSASSSGLKPVNPFDSEWGITDASLALAKNTKRKGKALWNLQCATVYENRDNNYSTPRIGFMLSGQPTERGILEYVGAAIRKMFDQYEMYRLQSWIRDMH